MGYPIPTAGASLLLAFNGSTLSPSSSSHQKQSILFISSRTSQLLSQRIFASLEASFYPLLATTESTTEISNLEVRHRVAQGEVSTVTFGVGADAGEGEWDSWFEEFENSKEGEGCRMVVMTDLTSSTSSSSQITPLRTESSALALSKIARRRRYFINISDRPDLSDFSFPITHRFPLDSSSTPSSTASSSSDKENSPLQLALTTNSNACRLSLRIQREIVASLPSNIGAGVAAVGNLRQSLKEIAKVDVGERDGEGELELTGCEFNRPVEQLTRERSRVLERGLEAKGENGEEERTLSPCRARRASRSSGSEESRSTSLSSTDAASTTPSSIAPSATWSAADLHRTRMRYVAQLSEYWPLDRLASVSLSTLSSTSTSSSLPTSLPSFSRHDLLPIISEPQEKKKGRIYLLGTGPGSPLLLTRLAYLFLTSPKGSPYYVDLFLSDKLVPPEILALIPSHRRAEVVIAKKYPGNAEHAQDELMRLAVEGANEGKTVLRMKQGDPYLYGRGGEEVLHFRKAGYESTIIPGLSSALAGPTIFNIPVTQRGVAESVVICTGVGRGGREVVVDGYSRSKTLCVLMGVARLASLIPALINHPTSSYPSYLPIALVERASSPDQRVVMATLETIIDVLGRISAHRPPGMLVIGWSVLALEGEGDMKVTEEEKMGEERDKERVAKWLPEEGYIVREGLGEEWRGFMEVVGE